MPRRTPLLRTRRYVFTIYKDEEDAESQLPTWNELPSKVRFLVWQVERCPTTGRLHVQGYVEFEQAQDMVWAQKNFHKGAYKKANGSAADNITYCTKEDTRVKAGGMFGTPSTGTGTRTDIRKFRDAVVGGKRKRDLINDMPREMAKYARFYNMIREQCKPVRENKMQVILALGSPGSGKTRFAFDHWGVSPDFFDLPMCANRIWFDGMDGHTLILMDDFDGRYSKLSLSFLLRLLDRYPRRVEIKGNFTWWLPDIVYITTNIGPDQWYNFHGRTQQVSALRRRIHYILDFDDKDANGDPNDITDTYDWSCYLCEDITVNKRNY